MTKRQRLEDRAYARRPSGLFRVHEVNNGLPAHTRRPASLHALQNALEIITDVLISLALSGVKKIVRRISVFVRNLEASPYSGSHRVEEQDPIPLGHVHVSSGS